MFEIRDQYGVSQRQRDINPEPPRGGRVGEKLAIMSLTSDNTSGTMIKRLLQP